MTMITIEMAAPVKANIKRRLAKSMVSWPKVVSIAVSRVSMETQADAKLMALAAEYTGL